VKSAFRTSFFREGSLCAIFLLGLMGCAAKKVQITSAQKEQARLLTEAARVRINTCSKPKPDRNLCKVPEFWLRPVESVKDAIKNAKLTVHPLQGVQEDLISGLAREGFLKIDPDSEAEIPPGAVIIYFGDHAYAEIKGEDGLYYSNRARRGSAFDKRLEVYTDAILGKDQRVTFKTAQAEFDSFYAFVKPAK
jgi:hypothetical protein